MLRGKGRTAFYSAVEQAARMVIATPITARDIEIEIAHATTTKRSRRMDTDNVNKPTLDALKGVAYNDDSQVRSARCTLFDRTSEATVRGRVEHLGRLFHSPHEHVLLIAIYSDSRLAELGGEDEVQRRRYEEWRREFDRMIASMRNTTA